MWMPAKPLRAQTSCRWASSHSVPHFFCKDVSNSSIVMVLKEETTFKTSSETSNHYLSKKVSVLEKGYSALQYLHLTFLRQLSSPLLRIYLWVLDWVWGVCVSMCVCERGGRGGENTGTHMYTEARRYPLELELQGVVGHLTLYRELHSVLWKSSKRFLNCWTHLQSLHFQFYSYGLYLIVTNPAKYSPPWSAFFHILLMNNMIYLK